MSAWASASSRSLSKIPKILCTVSNMAHSYTQTKKFPDPKTQVEKKLKHILQRWSSNKPPRSGAPSVESNIKSSNVLFHSLYCNAHFVKMEIEGSVCVCVWVRQPFYLPRSTFSRRLSSTLTGSEPCSKFRISSFSGKEERPMLLLRLGFKSAAAAALEEKLPENDTPPW